MLVDILILGAGWTSTFLIPLCQERSLTYAATSRSGRDGTIPFLFDLTTPSEDLEPFKALPDAKTVIITFPIVGQGAARRLVTLYGASRGNASKEEQAKGRTNWIQLGATSIWDAEGGHRRGPATSSTPKPAQNKWYDRHSPTISTPRGDAEDDLLALSSEESPTTVLNLAGLWGGQRSMKNWVGKVAPTKDVLRNKGSLHMIHGLDVARAILAIHDNFSRAQGQRWLVTDGRVYDWWDLASAWGSGTRGPSTKKEGEGGQTPLAVQDPPTSSSGLDGDRGPQARWVQELMEEAGVRALPRNVEVLGRALDSREFWRTFGLVPLMGRLEG